MKLMPASSAAWIVAIDVSWSGSPQPPNIIAPRHSGLTWIPVRPRLRYSMGSDCTPALGELMIASNEVRKRYVAASPGRVTSTE